MGKSVAEVLDSMDSRELTEWMAVFTLEHEAAVGDDLAREALRKLT